MDPSQEQRNASSSGMARPKSILDGIRVLDFGRHVAAPYGASLLADMGAEVIRVERPGGDEDRYYGALSFANGEDSRFLLLARNKKCVTLDWRNEAGRDLLRKLVEKSDVIIESFSPPGARAAGITYAKMKALRADIIVVSISGFGQDGPYSNRIGFDSIAQAMSGAASVTGFSGNPPTRTPYPWVDFSSGTMAALGAMFALFHRTRTGLGQHVDVSLMQTAAVFNSLALSTFMAFGALNEQIGNASSFVAPSDTFSAKDGWVFLNAARPDHWQRLVDAMGKPELALDPRFKDQKSRFENRHVLNPLINEWIGAMTTDEAVSFLEEARIACGPVLRVPQVVTDPQFLAREMLVNMDHPDLGKVPAVGTALKMSQTPGHISRPAPRLGEHNEDVYCKLLGLRQTELAKLKEEKVI